MWLSLRSFKVLFRQDIPYSLPPRSITMISLYRQGLHGSDARRARGPRRPAGVQQSGEQAAQARPQHLGTDSLEEGTAFRVVIVPAVLEHHHVAVVRRVARTKLLHSVHASL